MLRKGSAMTSTPQNEPGNGEFRTGNVLGVKVAAVQREFATNAICDRASERAGGYVCAAPVHSIMEGFDGPDFRTILNRAWMVVPDGLPVAVALRLQGFKGQPRVPGPDLMLLVCEEAARRGLQVGFYGSSDECLGLLREKLPQRAPGLKIAYTYSPPHRPLSAEEDAAVVREITESGVDLLFIGLGCPKQERWMHEHLDRISAVQLGVGAAFDFHAGLLKRAPEWMQKSGLEWFYRLVMEPKRLWWRYLKHNPRFVINVLLQRFGLKKFNTDPVGAPSH